MLLTVTKFLFLFSSLVFAQESTVVSTTSQSWAKFYSYAAEKNEYQFELGGMQENSALYWLGFTYGRNLGRCWGFSSTCSQYLDLNLGFANNYQATDELGLVGLRWQFASSSHIVAPFGRVFTGFIDEHDDVRGGAVGTGGVGVGFVAAVHPRLELSLEARAGEADRFWSLGLVSFSMRLDRMVNSTVQVTGDLIKSTIDAPKTFFDWFNKSEK